MFRSLHMKLVLIMLLLITSLMTIVGAFLMTEKVAEKSLVPGDHGTTYGGNPFATAAIQKVLDLFEEQHDQQVLV